MKLLFENWRQYINEGEEDFEPHMMYDPDTGEEKEVTTKAHHLELQVAGWKRSEKTHGTEKSTGPGLRIGAGAAEQYIDES